MRHFLECQMQIFFPSINVSVTTTTVLFKFHDVQMDYSPFLHKTLMEKIIDNINIAGLCMTVWYFCIFNTVFQPQMMEHDKTMSTAQTS